MVVRLKLLPYHEIIGYLSKIASEGQQVKLFFTFLKEVEVPSEAFSHDELQSFVGKKISIIHLDGEFYIKEIKKEE